MRTLAKQFQETLTKLTTERDQRPHEVDVGGGWKEPGWVVYERQMMLAEVNRERAARGLSPVSAEAIRRLETWACGHVDYVSKFALYCAELAVGRVVVP